MWQRGGIVVSTITAQRESPGFNSRFSVGFLRMLQFPPRSPQICIRLTSSQCPRLSALMKIWIWSWSAAAAHCSSAEDGSNAENTFHCTSCICILLWDPNKQTKKYFNWPTPEILTYSIPNEHSCRFRMREIKHALVSLLFFIKAKAGPGNIDRKSVV